ncbi:MAG: hypothetical protein JST12_13845 [Armatimonadetes bacterium]|nr:hypothetical protein [Armatimonadota bacterium]MBS1702741.1 hypothetical protein [Armatimonadota bacterium]
MRPLLTIALLTSLLVGCGKPTPPEPKVGDTRVPESTKPLPPSKTAEAAKSLPGLMKAGKLETKVQPRGETEVIATLEEKDLDKALHYLETRGIKATTKKEGSYVDIIVDQKDADKAGQLLLTDAEESGYNIHANASSPIKPDFHP